MFNFFKKKEENNENKAQNTGFGLLKNALSNTANSLIDSVVGVVTGDSIPDEFELDDIESMLIKADLGVELATAAQVFSKSRVVFTVALEPVNCSIVTTFQTCLSPALFSLIE